LRHPDGNAAKRIDARNSRLISFKKPSLGTKNLRRSYL